MYGEALRRTALEMIGKEDNVDIIMKEIDIL